MKALLIKRLGAGFWSDVDHVVFQVAAAEILGREPLVHWGTTGPYGNGRDETFTLYFRPISDVGLVSLVSLRDMTVWPDNWNEGNLADQLPYEEKGELNLRYGNYYFASEKAHVPAEHRTIAAMLGHHEDVIVSYAWESPVAILKMAKGSRFQNQSPDDLRSLIFNERIRLKPEVRQQVDAFWDERLAGDPVLAVHVRGSDKLVENPALGMQNKRALQIAQKWRGRVFLMTDSEPYRQRWLTEFGDRLVTQDCLRTTSAHVPNFLLPRADGYRNGLEIIIDTYTAARCDRFLGTYSSNVGKYVAALGGRVRFLDRGPWRFVEKLVGRAGRRFRGKGFL